MLGERDGASTSELQGARGRLSGGEEPASALVPPAQSFCEDIVSPSSWREGALPSGKALQARAQLGTGRNRPGSRCVEPEQNRRPTGSSSF